MVSRRRVMTLLVCGAMVMMIGCAPQAAVDRPETFPATGTVTYNGSPVANAVVTLVTADADARGATGRTDDSGKFTLMTFEPGDGALPGSYGVTVVVNALPAGVTDQNIEIGDVDTDAEPAATGGSDAVKLPEKYASAENSGLTAEITEGENTLKFELTD